MRTPSISNLHTPVPASMPQGEQVYLTRFDLKTAFSNADKYIVWYNSTQASVKDHIRGGTLATYFRILEAFVRHNNYVQLLAEQPVPCRLNNCMLAYQLKVNRRTIINHLNKLEKAGFIIKTFRGTFADYELLIPVTVLLNQPTKAAEISNNAKNVPPIRLVNNLEKSNILPSPCELGDNVVENSGQPPLSADAIKPLGHFSCYTPKAGVVDVETPPLSTAVFPEQKLGGGAAAKKYPAWQLAMVQDFYRYAMPVLYPYHEFTPDMGRKIKNKLFKHVYAGFKESNFTRRDWEEYQKNLMERIDMVAVWKDKPAADNTPRFIVNPLTYFDNTCSYGFVKTEEWLMKKRRQMALIKAEIELEKACKEMIKDGDRLRIYTKWETRFKNKKLPEIMPVFYRAMAKLQQQLATVKQSNDMVN